MISSLFGILFFLFGHRSSTGFVSLAWEVELSMLDVEDKFLFGRDETWKVWHLKGG